jgi:hypothetical protein
VRPAEARKYVLFAQGRTGSTLLGELIASHPRAFFADEILRAKVPATRMWAEAERRRHPREVFGFHVKIYQLTDVQGVRDPTAWLRGMHRHGWRVIALRRRNLLRHVLSNMTITATGTVHDRSGTSGGAAGLTVDPAELVYWMEQRARVGAAEDTALREVPHVALTYEDDLADPERWADAAGRVFAHLGLDPAPVTTTLRRRNPGRLTELIANYDEVAAALAGAPYGQYLDD